MYARHGLELMGESPLYDNLEVFIVMDTNKSTSRRQGRFARRGLKEAQWQTYEMMNRNRI